MKDSKITSRQAQAIKTRNKLYKIALEELEEKGFENITIEKICRKANVSVGTFYLYFKSKTDILKEIFNKADDFFLSFPYERSNDKDSLSVIVEYFDYYAKYNEITGIDTTKQIYTTKNNMFATKDRYMVTLLNRLISNGQKKGEISTDMSVEEIGEYLFVAARGVVFNWCLHDGQFPLEDAMHKYMERIVSIFKAYK